MTDVELHISRRRALGLLTVSAAGLACKSLLGEPQLPIRTSELLPQTPGLGRKFTAEGVPLPFAGNTVICPLDHNSELSKELSGVHDEWQRHNFIKRIALVSTNSYHMTVFSGANDQDRKPGRWPSDIPLDVPMVECNHIVEQRLRKARFPLVLPLRFRIDDDPANQVLDGSGIRLVPFNEEENRKVRNLRDELARVVEFRTPDHDTYKFHITLGYWVQPFTLSEMEDYKKTLAQSVALLKRKNQSIELQAPVYCIFDNMMAYHPIMSLAI